MRTRICLLIIATLLLATVASAAPYRYAVVTFYNWKQPISPEQMSRAKIDQAFLNLHSVNAMEKGLNAGAAEGWEPVTTTFVPGTPGEDDPRRAADKLVVIMRNPNPPKNR